MIAINPVTILSFAILIFIPDSYQLVQSDGKRLIKLNEIDPAKWLNQEEINLLLAKRTNFMDITNHEFPGYDFYFAKHEFPESLRFQSVINSTFKSIDISRMTAFVDTFDNYTNRYYNSQSGVDASVWLASQVAGTINNSSYNGSRVTVDKFRHSWAQNSVIAQILGADPELKDEIIIFGAHLDSINSRSPARGVAPGSDDNASGCVTLLESLRIILQSNFVPKRSIEFHFYAGEEVGLRGSLDIAESYYKKGAKVVAMINYDIVGYNAGENDIGFVTDYTSKKLTDFLKMVVKEYCSYTVVDHVCGYGCSDHASFNKYKFPAACASENPINPYMHGKNDTSDKMSFEQVAEFVKMTIAAGIELAELV